MLNKIINAVKSATKDFGVAKRSNEWPKLEKSHLEANPFCACCSSKNNLQVHHKKPFHLHPELELDPTNLITLCMDNDCHLLVGHGDSFKAYNPDVESDAKLVFSKKDSTLKETLKDVADKAKIKRLFE